jgi:hypothetical protein
MEMSWFVKGMGQILEVTWTSTGQIQQVRRLKYFIPTDLMEMSPFLKIQRHDGMVKECDFKENSKEISSVACSALLFLIFFVSEINLT